MGLSRTARIKTLLFIDTVFFFIELITGYAIGSLALVADSFHMLNDVMSLVVALYAIKLTTKNAVDSRYSYGWHRAEILAALVNGVFLLALCFSIFMEAIERFFSVPEISNPRLVIIVGSFGLASNIVGLFLFHEHSHSHSHSHSTPSSPPPEETEPTISDGATPPPKPIEIRHSRRRSSSSNVAFSPLYGHPAATRASLVLAAEEMAAETEGPSTASSRSAETTPLLNAHPDSRGQDHSRSDTHSHDDHGHKHSHSGSMNMQGILLHVLGDALGNVGVIATGLVIMLSTWQYKFYFDPVISLVITVIIFSSALPLVRSTSFILLQAVPPHVSLDDVRRDILSVDGVLSVHELHIWQLSETKTVASVHVRVAQSQDFMPVAQQIRKLLHHQGVHSSTIQPEYASTGEVPKNTESNCLIECPRDQQCDPQENACCPPPPAQV
ncbi:cation efflux protein [Marasmius fiardii PR-910]|nr:cation efflux protein [Marasmius fiardii PR-910]